MDLSGRTISDKCKNHVAIHLQIRQDKEKATGRKGIIACLSQLFVLSFQ